MITYYISGENNNPLMKSVRTNISSSVDKLYMNDIPIQKNNYGYDYDFDSDNEKNYNFDKSYNFDNNYNFGDLNMCLTDRNQKNNLRFRGKKQNFIPTKNISFKIENNSDFRVIGSPFCCRCKMSRAFIPNIRFYYCNKCKKLYCEKCLCHHVTCSCIYE